MKVGKFRRTTPPNATTFATTWVVRDNIMEGNVREGYALVRGYLEAHRDEIDIANLDLAAFILVTTVEALTHCAVLRRPDILADERAGEFVDEVTRLVVRYLRAS